MAACPVCGGEDYSKLWFFRVPSRYDGIKYPLFMCKKCGLVRPVPLPYTERSKYDIYDEEGITKCYDPSEKRIEFGSKEYLDYFRNFRPYAECMKGLGIKGRHLDVGCGSGHLMKISRDLGMNAEGVELNSGIMRAMRDAGYIVHDREICDPYYPDGQYDLVTLNHVLEHIDDIKGFVRCINRVLKEGGHVMMAMPYIHGLIPRILRTSWYGHGSGQHLNFFSFTSIMQLLEGQGFDMVVVKVNSMDYAPLGLPETVRKMIDAACAVIARMGLGDNLFVVAKKVRDAGGETE